MRLTFIILPLEDQGYTYVLKKHWYIKERCEKEIKEKDYHDFGNTVVEGKLGHKTVAAIMGGYTLVKQTEWWNPSKWKWNSMKEFHKQGKKEKISHPYQRDKRTEHRKEGGSRTMGQRIDIMNGLMNPLAKEMN